MKSNEEWLAETAESKPLTKEKLRIIGELALLQAKKTGHSLLRINGVEIEVSNYDKGI